MVVLFQPDIAKLPRVDYPEKDSFEHSMYLQLGYKQGHTVTCDGKVFVRMDAPEKEKGNEDRNID